MKQEDWLKTFRKFYSDKSHGSGAWFVSPSTVEVFIKGLLNRQKIERQKNEKK